MFRETVKAARDIVSFALLVLAVGAVAAVGRIAPEQLAKFQERFEPEIDRAIGSLLRE